jgi:iron complex outermembrane receptor protein
MRIRSSGNRFPIDRPAPRTGKLTVGAALFGCAILVQASQVGDGSLLDLSLDELASIEVTSVSKKPERLAAAAAAVYVITNEEIRRSGVTSLAEALRMAPNLQVARISAQNYAITARGFNSSTANKLLVLIDGRTVYTPLYSGVFWDAQDLLLEDIERIEVISGPGGTLWGTNAVNGVINVITRHARDSDGTFLSAAAGNDDRTLSMRHGAALGPDAYFRVYGKANRRDHSTTARGSALKDAWHNEFAGMRADWELDNGTLSVQAEASRARLDQLTLPREARVSGANLSLRWQRRSSSGNTLYLVAYVDRTERNFPGSYHQTLGIANIELQQALPKMGLHELVWGASYRQANDRMNNSATLAFLPVHLHQSWSSVFIQDDMQLAPAWRLTAGLRLERNDYTGLEVLPNLRLAWQPEAGQLVWGALSRAVRAPSRVDRDLYAPALPPYVLEGNSTFRSELATVLELGYRRQYQALSYSANLFHADFDHLRTLDRLPSGVFTVGNKLAGTNSGIEAWGTYQAQPGWRLSAGLTLLHDRLRMKPGANDPNGTASAGNDPAHTWRLRSAWDINPAAHLAVTLRRVGALPRPAVPSYFAVDFSLGWKVTRDAILSLSAQNLLGGRRPEFGALPNRSEFGPRALAQLTLKI